MKQIFEQFQFIPKMILLSSEKVQECGMWSITVSLFVWLIDVATRFTVNIIGMSALYAILLFMVMVTDFATGIKASKKEWLREHPGKKWHSELKKGLQWAIKYITYISGFFIVNVIYREICTIHIGDMGDVNIDAICMSIIRLIKLFLMLYILRWELKSIDENIERLGYNFKIFDFLDNSIAAITSLIKSKTDIDINDKKEDNDK